MEDIQKAIEVILERLDAQDDMIKAALEKISSLDKMIFDDIIYPANEAMKQAEYNTGLGEFSDKYSDKFEGYNDKLRPIEGEDFDIVKQAYDGYNEIEGEKPDEAAYVDELVNMVDEQLEEIRAAIGAAPDAEVAIVSDGETGETTIEVEGQEVPAEEGAAENAVDEEPDAEDIVNAEDIVYEDAEAESDPEDLAKLEEELRNYKM